MFLKIKDTFWYFRVSLFTTLTINEDSFIEKPQNMMFFGFYYLNIRKMQLDYVFIKINLQNEIFNLITDLKIPMYGKN